MWYHPGALILSKRDVIAAWIVCLVLVAAYFGSPMLAAALGTAAGGVHLAATACNPVL
jgi:hypothetical protein